MSKVIKACFVINDTRPNRPELNHKSSPETAIPCNAPQDEGHLTREMAEAIYIDTKNKIEELIHEAQKRADNLILQARAQSQEEIERGQLESEGIRAEAYKDGFELGYQEGFAKAEGEIKVLGSQAAELFRRIQTDKDEYLRNQEEGIVDIIMILTEKILGTTVELKPEIIKHIVRKTLEEVKDSEKIHLRINPVHLPYISVYNDHFNDNLTDKLQVIEDPSIKPGDCLIVTENGFVESRMDEQMVLLKQALLEVTGHAGI